MLMTTEEISTQQKKRCSSSTMGSPCGCIIATCSRRPDSFVEEAANGVEGLEKALADRFRPRHRRYQHAKDERIRVRQTAAQGPGLPVHTGHDGQHRGSGTGQAQGVRSWREFLYGRARIRALTNSNRSQGCSQGKRYKSPACAVYSRGSEELIQQSAAGILRLEKDPNNEVAINEIFRAVHTLKGSSGLFDAQPLTKLVHAGEDVLSAVRLGALQLNAEIADHILDMLDQAGIWLGDMEKDETLPPAAGEASHKLAKVLRSFLPQSADGVAEPPSASSKPDRMHRLAGCDAAPA